eukprot:Gregarina_sp_Poly_1__3164@NODE_189_length_11663_cov_119_423594_g168_i0_p3_GENE_NODE_189_length_11663_cov_119_423594_g168_i0NODE_189_length_11663_cov_119_423594_g168_i0_p3_ORF_typecomplete_len450_score64_42PCI/PF01399_27/0_0002_NODE_189_length_11663_cov_119_423594_g168_i0933910688
MASLGQWISEVQRAFSCRNNGALAWLFTPKRVIQIPSVTIPAQLKLIKQEDIRYLSPTDITYYIGTYATNVSPAFQELLICYIGLLQAANAASWEKAVDSGLNALDVWVTGIRSSNLASWTIPALSSLCSFIVDVGEIADDQAQTLKVDMWEANDEPGGDVDDTATSNLFLQQVLNGIRQHIGKFRGDDANQGAYMILLSESIRVCLKLRNVQMAAAFLRTVPTNQPVSPTAPRGPATKFKYYYGNLLLQRESFAQAEEPLVWSFNTCPSKNVELKRSILACLVAVRLRLGQIPPEGLIEQYKLNHYRGIITAAKNGDLRLFDDCMSKFATEFYKDGTTLCLDRVKFVVQRTLCRRAYAWALQNFFSGSEPTNIVPLGLFTAAFKWQVDAKEDSSGLLFDEEEMMCVLANLVRLDYVRGYIAWQPRKFVFSKKAPFPSITDGGGSNPAS